MLFTQDMKDLIEAFENDGVKKDTEGRLPRHGVAERRSREAHPASPRKLWVRRVGLGPPSVVPLVRKRLRYGIMTSVGYLF